MVMQKVNSLVHNSTGDVHQPSYVLTREDNFLTPAWMYKNVFDHSIDGIILHRATGEILEFNPKATEMFGYSAEAATRLQLTHLHSPEVSAQVEQALEQVLSVGSMSFETVFVRQDGSQFPAEVSASLFEVDGEKIVQGIVRDISQRKQVETLLQQQLEKERLIHTIALRIRESLDLESCLQTTVDEVRQFLGADRALIYQFNSDWSGHVPVESVALGWASVFKQTIQDPCFDHTYAEYFSEGNVRVVNEITSENYRDCYLNFLAQFQVQAHLIVPILQGDDLWGLLMVHQCSAPRQWQDLEIDLLQKLSTQVAIALQQAELYSRTQSELAERIRIAQALKESRDDALAADRTKSEFLAVVSHELRTPMNGVIGMTGLLLDTELSAHQKGWVTTIRNCGDSLLELINRILDFSKIETENLVLEDSPFQIHTCIEETLDLLSAKAAAKQLELSSEIAPDIPFEFVGDVNRLRQILLNLLSNAIKFTDRGTVSIQVSRADATDDDPLDDEVLSADLLKDDAESSCIEESQGDKYLLQFAVADTGIGIAADKFDRLFQPFSQVDSSISRQYGGTGLGLVISQRLSELMGGRMWVESSVGQGSCFYFTVCLQAARPAVSLAGKHILVATPDVQQQALIASGLAQWQATSYIAQSSYEVLGMIAHEDSIDVAIISCHMNDMNSDQLIGALRSHHSTLPIVVLSDQVEFSVDGPYITSLVGDISQHLLQKALHSCFVETVRKPTGLLDASLSRQLPLKILVAEDNLVNQQLVQQWLQKLGYRADLVGNGYEVLEALHRQSYDLVLMDVQMPEMDGITATRRIREQWSAADRPTIIAMTANVMAGDRDRCLAAGMDSYLSKPILTHELAAAIEKCGLEKHQEKHQHLSRFSKTQPLTVLETVSGYEAAGPQSKLDSQLTSEAAEQPLVNRQVLETTAESLGGLTQSWLMPFLELYKQQSTQLLQQIEAACQTQQSEKLSYAAHTLKSSSAALGLERVAHYCQQLEQCGRTQQMTEVAELFSALRELFEPSFQALETLSYELPKE